MTEPQPDVWHNRDLQVLGEITRRLDGRRDAIGSHQLVEATGLSEDEIDKAIQNLVRGGYITVDGPWNPTVIDITERALREVGLWPTPETALQRVIAALEAIADNTDEDEDTRSRARKILEALGGAGKQIGISLATAVLTGQIT